MKQNVRYPVYFCGAWQREPVVAEGTHYTGRVSRKLRVPIGYWQSSDYERQWREAAQRLIQGEECSGFFTTMYQPEKANFLAWWPAWRFGSEVRVQNHLLFLEELKEEFDLADPYRHVQEWEEAVSDGGQPISNWVLLIGDFEAFLERSGANERNPEPQ